MVTVAKVSIWEDHGRRCINYVVTSPLLRLVGRDRTTELLGYRSIKLEPGLA